MENLQISLNYFYLHHIIFKQNYFILISGIKTLKTKEDYSSNFQKHVYIFSYNILYMLRETDYVGAEEILKSLKVKEKIVQ